MRESSFFSLLRVDQEQRGENSCEAFSPVREGLGRRRCPHALLQFLCTCQLQRRVSAPSRCEPAWGPAVPLPRVPLAVCAQTQPPVRTLARLARSRSDQSARGSGDGGGGPLICMQAFELYYPISPGAVNPAKRGTWAPAWLLTRLNASSTDDQGHVCTCSLSQPGGSLIPSLEPFLRDPSELLHSAIPSWELFSRDWLLS